jgi:hypothetical protein
MGLRFYRRISLLPGLRLNASRSGLSLSIGHRGAWYTVGPRGRRVDCRAAKRPYLASVFADGAVLDRAWAVLAPSD